jgi:small-conductance mechanosensitive channel
MNFFVTPTAPAGPQLTDSLPQDEHFFRHIEQGWQTDLAHFIQYGVPKLLFAFVLAFAFQSAVNFFVRRMNKRAEKLVGNSRRSAQLRTMATITRATSYGIVGFYLLTQILGALGVSLGPFIASAGVIGLGISFGAQSIFKDMLTGIFILIEDQYSVGDTIKIASLTGTVEDLSLRVTRMRDGDGTLYIVPNSQITTVSNLSRDFAAGTLNVTVDAREDPDRVVKLLKTIAAGVRKDEASIAGYTVTYPINVRVMVNQRDAVMRELRRRVLQAFAKEDVAFAAATSMLTLETDAPPPTSPAPERTKP